MIPGILEQHRDEVATLFDKRLWYQRCLDLVRADLAPIDLRLRRHFDGLAVDLGQAVELGCAEVDGGSPGDGFAATAAALLAGPESAVVLNDLEWSADTLEGCRWAMRLVPGAEPTLATLSEGDGPVTWAARAGLASRGAAPAPAPDRPPEAPVDPAAYAQTAGLLGWTEHLEGILELASADDDPVASAAWEAGLRLDATTTRRALRAALERGGANEASAYWLGACGDPEDVSLLEGIAHGSGEDEPVRSALLGLGNLGLPQTVPFLIRCLSSERWSGIATVALQRILGDVAPLREHEGTSALPDLDEDLLVWSQDELETVWNRAPFADGVRHRFGRPLEVPESNDATPLGLLPMEQLEIRLAGSPSQPPFPLS